MSFKTWWKELRCDHIFKQDGEEEFLRKARECDSDSILPGMGAPRYSNYEYYAIKSHCIKCGMKKVEQKRYLII